MKKQIITLLILTILLISPYAQSVDAITRYTRIANPDAFYIITGESTNSSNTHYNYYRIELNPTTHELINKTKFNRADTHYNNRRISTPYFYDNKLLTGFGIYNIDTLNELSESTALFTETPSEHENLNKNAKHHNHYEPLKKYYLTTTQPLASTLSGVIVQDTHLNTVYDGVGMVGATFLNFIYGQPKGSYIRRTGTTSASYYYPSGKFAFSNSADMSSGFRLYASELLPSGSLDPAFYYTNPNSAGNNVFVQKRIQNNTDAVRTITSSLTYINSLTPVSSRSNYVYAVGYNTFIGDNSTAYNVSSIEVWDRTGNVISGFNSGTPDTQYNFITELETGGLAVIEENRNTSTYRLLIYNPLTLTVENTINYEQTELMTVSSRLKNTKGIDPVQYNQMNSGVYSREIGGFDAVPKDAYTFLETAIEPTNTTITNVDLTNRQYALEFTTTNNIDYYPLHFLVDDGEFKTTSTERYGYFILSDMTKINSVNTGSITSTDTYDFNTALSNNRFYVIDMNISLQNTSIADYVTTGIKLNDEPLFSIINQFNEPTAGSHINDFVGLYIENIAGLELTTPHSIAYPQIAGTSLDYIGLKLLIDKHNNRWSANKIVYYSDGSNFESSFITWSPIQIPSSESITNITFDVGSSAVLDVDLDIYRQNNLPVMNTRNADSTYITAKNLLIPILKEGENKVYIIYSDAGTQQHANFYEWNINIDVIGGTILGIGPSGEITDTPTGEGVSQGSPILGGLLPDFMGTTQQSVMFYSFAITLLAMIIIFIMGAGAGYNIVGFIGALAFGTMLIIYFSIVGWLPAWIPVLGFVMAGLIGASMIRNAFVGGT